MNFLFVMLLSFFSPFFVSCFIFYIYYRFIKHIKPKKSEFKHLKRGTRSIFSRLFLEFPAQLVQDNLYRNPDEFPLSETGLHIIEGSQGSGKTTVLTYLLNKYQSEYPALKVYTNYDYIYQDEPFVDWKSQFQYEVGVTGCIYAIDEIHVWLCSSLESKDFPPELITEISQNRKNHRKLFGTVQVFNRCPKPIREQTKLLYTPFTFFGCLTFCLVREPVLSSDASIDRLKFRNLFFFVQTNKLRSMFDTLNIIRKMGVNNLVRNNENIELIDNNDVSIIEKKDIKKKKNSFS